MSETRPSLSKKRRATGKGKPKPPTPEVVSEKRSHGRVGILAVAVAVLAFVAVIVQLSALEPNTKGQAEEFRNYDSTLALLATSLRVSSLLLFIVVGWFLYRVIQRREPTAPPYVLYLGVAACVLLAVVSMTGSIAFNHVVNTFLDLPAAQQTNDMAEQLNDDNTVLRIRSVIEIASGVVFGAWLAVVCAGAVGVGLMPRFLAYYGYGVAAMLVFAPLPGGALFVGWIAAVALLLLNHWPGGRPPSWDSGRAEPITW